MPSRMGSDFMYREYRCQNCRKLFFKGDIEHATIEIKCKSCKQINTIRDNKSKSSVLADNKESSKRDKNS